MKKKIKFFPGILVLTILAVVSAIIAGSLFELALLAMKNPAGIIGAMLILVLFILVMVVCVILTCVDLPLTITSLTKSEKKTFPLIMLIVESIILIIAIILVILFFTQR